MNKKSIFQMKGNELQNKFNELGLETDGTDWDEKYIYVYGKDVFQDNNNGLLWGVQTDDSEGDVDYVEWYSSLNKLLKETKKMKITNKEQFLSRFKTTHKIDRSGKVRKVKLTNAEKQRYLASLRYQFGNKARELSKSMFGKSMEDLTSSEDYDKLFVELRK